MSAPPPARPAGASRGSWYVGVLAVIILGYILVNTLRTEGPGSQGPKPGKPLPAFAAPLVLSSLDGDANVATPGHLGGAGRVPACTVRRPDVLNSCDLSARAPSVLGFLATRGGDCTGSFDAIDRLSRRWPDVRFAGVIIRGDRGDARKLVRKHRWRFPIVFDRDGGVSTLYGIAVCPEVVLAYPGGAVRETVIGNSEAQLDRRVAALVTASRARGWEPPR